MNIPVLSIIIPVYNVEAYLEKCLQSLLSQTFKNFEILLINDGSTDNSGKICDDFAEVNSFINVYHKKNEGVSTARNLGIKNATGEWIFFLDADDWIDECFFDILNFSNSDVDIIQFGYKKINSDNNLIFTLKPDINIFYKNCIDYQKRAKFKLMNVVICFYRRSIIIKNQIWFSKHIKYGEDLEFSIKLFGIAKGIQQLNFAYYNYLERKGSTMDLTVTVSSIVDHLLIGDNLIKYFKIEQFCSNEFYGASLIYFIKSFFSRSVIVNVSKESVELLQNEYNKFFDKNEKIVGKLNILFKLSRININFYRFLLKIRRLLMKDKK